MFVNGLDSIRLVEEMSFNDRTIVTWFDMYTKKFQFALFHISDQPNTPSKASPYSMWGFTTFVSQQIEDPKEMAEVTALFVTDLLAEDFWWEDDENLVLTDDIVAKAEAMQKELDNEEVNEDTELDKPKRANLTLVVNNESDN